MARLSPDQVKEILKTPKNKAHIISALQDEARIIMHTEPVRELGVLPETVYERWIAWIATFLPAEKVVPFRQLVTTPLDTIESTKGVFDELSKFLDGQDKYIKFELASDNLEDDLNNYLSKLKDGDFWRTKGFDKLKTKPSSFLVVDIAQEQNTARPEPYYFFVDLSCVHDVDINQMTGVIEYLIYKRSDGKMVVLDDEFYRLYSSPNNDGVYIIELENYHSIYSEGGKLSEGLGYTPACSFYDIPMYDTSRISKRGPLSDTVGKLDWLLFWRISKRYLDLYGAWPIMSTYKEQCDYKDAENNHCENGFINFSTYSYSTDNGSGAQPIQGQRPCPVCKKRKFIGPGTHLTIDAPADKDQFDIAENAVKFFEMSNDKLEFVVTEAERLENEIHLNCVGLDGDAMNTQAINENQVHANFESKEAILNRIQTQFERSQKFVIETICKLRYGSYYLSGVVDYGTEHFLKSVDDLLKQYDAAKKSGMPMYYLATLRDQITRTRFKNNPEQLQRDYILAQLEPWLDISLTEAALFSMVDPETYALKVNFISLIQRFERDVTNIVEFGSLISFKDKINIITQKLLSYVREKPLAPSAQPEPGRNGGAPPAAN